jgi:hypothetical protein
MNPNPLADREKALENQYIREKESVLVDLFFCGN